MNSRILITYATRAGSTAEVAGDLGEVLGERGFIADVVPVKENPPLEGYQGVLIGSAIRMGNWLPEAVQFIQNNQQALRHVPVALFTVHGINLGDDEHSRASREAYLDAVRPFLTPMEHVFFPGKIDPARLSLIDRLMVRLVKAPIGDLRDWKTIDGWAQSVLN